MLRRLPKVNGEVVGPGFDPSSRHSHGTDIPLRLLGTEKKKKIQRLTPSQPTLTFSRCLVFGE